MLRNQGLADLLAAHVALVRDAAFLIDGQRTTLAHVVLAKCQQASEKLVKGYLLWHYQSFDPTKGHTPLETTLAEPTTPFGRLIHPLRNAMRANPATLDALRWLEGLAPNPPQAEGSEAIESDRLQPNTEYPFWSEHRQCLVTPAQMFDSRWDGIRATRAVRTLCHALVKAGPAAYSGEIGHFLDRCPSSKPPEEWDAR